MSCRMAARWASAVWGLSLYACDPFVFDDLEDDAATLVLEAPDGYPSMGRFGTSIASYEGTLRGESVSRFVVSAGADSPYLVYEGWNPQGLGLGGHLVEGCNEPGDCDEGSGVSVAGLPEWGGGELCVLTTAPAAGSVNIRCESEGGSMGTFGGFEDLEFGVATAAVRAGNATTAIIGAPGSDGGDGRIYRLPDGAAPVALDLGSSAVAPSAGRLGASLAAYPRAGGGAWVAAGAPAGDRVVVFELDDEGVARVRACVEDGTNGWGGTLALGDLTGDGEVDLVVGTDPSTLQDQTDSGRDADGEVEPTVVHVYDGQGLPDPGGCVPWESEPEAIDCPEGVQDLLCEGSGFGRRVAIGDLDADGDGDLLVSAPFATVSRETWAGAVYVFEGPDLTPRDALTHSSPENGDQLGATLAVVSTDLSGSRREEPVATSPGRNAALVFLCSSLETQDGSASCRPVADGG